jgi:hypothetical protein
MPAAGLDLTRQIGSPLEEAHALAGLGRCALAADRTAQAEDRLRQALAIFQRIGAAEAAWLPVWLPGGGRLCGTYLDQSPAWDAMDAADRAITTRASIHPTLWATPDCVSLQAGR